MARHVENENNNFEIRVEAKYDSELKIQNGLTNMSTSLGAVTFRCRIILLYKSRFGCIFHQLRARRMLIQRCSIENQKGAIAVQSQ